MKLSLSVNLSDILTEKKSILENIFSWGSIFDNGFHPGRVFRLVNETNLDGIELVASKNMNERDIERVKKILGEHRVSVLSLHQPILTIYKIGLEGIQKLFEAASRLSAKAIVIHIFSLGNKIHDVGFIKLLKSLEEKYGIKIGLENGTKNIIIGLKHHCYREKEFSEIIAKLELGITFDTTHLAQADSGDIIGFYKKNKERIINIHLSDYKYGWLPHNLFNTHMALEKGDLPMEEFLKTIKEDRYDGLLTFEINRSAKEIKKSIDFARQFSDQPQP